MDLIKFDQDFKPVATLVTFQLNRKRREVVMIDKRFGFYARDDNSFAWGINDAYIINIVSPDGKIIRRIVKDYDPVKVTAEDRQEMYEDSFGERELPSDVSLNFPKYYPSFYGFLCDDEGRILIVWFEGPEVKSRYWDGTAWGEEQLVATNRSRPWRLSVAWIGNGKWASAWFDNTEKGSDVFAKFFDGDKWYGQVRLPYLWRGVVVFNPVQPSLSTGW